MDARIDPQQRHTKCGKWDEAWQPRWKDRDVCGDCEAKWHEEDRHDKGGHNELSQERSKAEELPQHRDLALTRVEPRVA